jgi:hypothetical protein
VKISKAGNLVSLEVELSPNPDKAKKFNPLDLPTLLTEGAIFLENTETNLAQGSVITEGAIDASGTQGGQVALIGQQVSVGKGFIDVSGANGGGTVRIGGDYQGKGSIPNATTTLVDGKSQIKADALTQGNGGKVIVWADGNTQFDGKISAKGGLLGGDGGFVETSGKQSLDFSSGQVDASAFLGLPGSWLLDPSDITIDVTQATNISNSLNNGTSVELSTIGGTGGQGDVLLNSSINKTGSNSSNLTISASRYITPSSGSTINLASGNLTLNLNQESLAVFTNPTIKNAINSVGTVSGSTNINLGSGTYIEGEISINKSFNITGNGASNTIISGNNASRVLNISGTGTTVNLDGLKITQGSVSNNNGGGILVNSGTTLNLKNSTLSNNSATGTGGGGNEGSGGGIYNSGILTISNSTLSGNSTNVSGGGIKNHGTLDVSNSTLSGNSASYGGGINNGSSNISGILTVRNSTFSGNSAVSGGGFFNDFSGQVTIRNSIVAGNTASSSFPEVNNLRTFTSLGNNLIGQNGNAGGFPTISSDIILSGSINNAITPLGNYGGTTQTHALLPGSPAINAAGAGATTTDQRGVAAVGTRDIGAFESRGFTLTPISGSTPQTTNVTQSFTNPLAVQVVSLDGISVTGGTVNFASNGTSANANLNSSTATINSSGQAQVSATANNQAGSYTALLSIVGKWYNRDTVNRR